MWSLQPENVSSTWLRFLLWLYLLTETFFLAMFIFYIVPRCNMRTPPKPFRDYGEDRHKLFLRILNRIERTCRSRKCKYHPVLEEFISDWFQRGRIQQGNCSCDVHDKSIPPHLITSLSMTSEISTSDDSWCPSVHESLDNSPTFDDDEEKITSAVELHKEDVYEFLSGAFFGTTYGALDEREMKEFQKILDLFLQQTKQLCLLPGRSPSVKPLRLSLEDVNPIPRPLLIYFLVAIVKVLANLFLRSQGFQRYVSTTGLVYWFRPSASKAVDVKEKLLPFLFFHGIAPAAFALYLPTVLYGLANDDRAIFLFENSTIACMLGFHALTEEETTQGVQEAISQHVHPNTDVCVCGHSFGSCQLTWLLHSPLRRRIKQFILLDPVSILLSEPDVLASFLYSNPCRKVRHLGHLEQLWDWLVRLEMRLAVSSEVFTEYYLRRHFSWYNSELWLDDLPCHVRVLVCLAERDEITCTSKVVEEIEIYNNNNNNNNNSQLPWKAPRIQWILWNKVGHGYCLASPQAWQRIKKIMIEQEHSIIHENLNRR